MSAEAGSTTESDRPADGTPVDETPASVTAAADDTTLSAAGTDEPPSADPHTMPEDGAPEPDGPAVGATPDAVSGTDDAPERGAAAEAVPSGNDAPESGTAGVETEAGEPAVGGPGTRTDRGGRPGRPPTRESETEIGGTSPRAMRWTRRHLLDVDELSVDDVQLVMTTADDMVAERTEGSAAPILRGRQVTLLFYEASTRTRVSFEVAAKRLGADVVNVTVAASSVAKGESLIDTLRTLAALGSDIVVLRHARSGAPYLAARHFSGQVVNAGDGWHAHPTQALIDLYTLRARLADGDLARLRGRKLVILGDVLHSRVARSNVWTLTSAGMDVWLCGPAPLLAGFAAWTRQLRPRRRVTVTTDPDVALRDADAVMALRIQRERQDGGLLTSLGEYTRRYGLTRERLALARPGALVLHPGPMNEGVEIAPDVAAGDRSLIVEQVASGVAVRMAVLAVLAGRPSADATP